MKKKPTVAKPWFYDRSKFIRSEEDRRWNEERANAADASSAVPVIAAAPPAAPEPAVATPPLEEMPLVTVAEGLIATALPSKPPTPPSPENSVTPPLKPWWKRLLRID